LNFLTLQRQRMFNGERLKQAREIRGLLQADLAKAIGRDQSYVSLLEQNARTPTDDMLNALALAVRFPAAFLRSPSGPDFPLGSLLYRKTRSLESVDAARLRQNARLIFELMNNMGRSFQLPECRIPIHASSKPEMAAQVARSALGFSPDSPVAGLLNKLEKNGVFVYRLPCDIPGYDGFSAWSGDEALRAVLVLSFNAPGDRQRFTIAHELGHLVMHRSFLGNLRDLDREANLFASEFLTPATAMRQEIKAPLTLTRLAELKARWGVSISSLIERAEQLGIINQRQKKYIRKRLAENNWEIQEPVEIPSETPRLLTQMAERLFGAPVDMRKLAMAVNAPPRLMEEVVQNNRKLKKETIAGTGEAATSASATGNPVLTFRPR
jgi:Zn-dependent peptidase ImmA (M78 family)